MPEGGKVTPIAPGIIARLTQATRYIITGNSSSYFPAGQPLAPQAPADVKGRQFDYPTYVNTTHTPRGNEPVSFHDLRALADSCDILRSVIETRKDQMEALDWNIRIKPDDDNKRKSATAEQQKRIEALTEFFQSPDKEHSWEQWLRQWLEDMFVIDAAAFYKRRTRKGELYSLDLIDGATLKVLIDDSGRRPIAPDPAYQQIIKGMPAVDYTAEELLYLKHNPRTNRFYGYSHVEQIILTINTAIRRDLSVLEYYREGSQPDAFMGLPKEWTTDQVVSFQKHWDGMMSGNLAQRRHLKFLPGDFKYQATKEPALKDEYDEWIARKICFVFSIAATPFIKANNRATAQSSHDAALEEGLAPLQKYVRNNLNRIIAAEFDSPDLEFSWVDDREQDPWQAAQIREGDVKLGIISIDEARETIGLVPLGDGYATPMALTATGYVAIKSPEEQQADSDAAAQAQADALQAHLAQNADDKDDDAKPSDQKGKAKQNDDHSADTERMVKGVKKKRANPYLPMTGRPHRHAEKP